MPEATLTSKGQLTLPKAIRDLLGVGAGDRLVFWQDDDGRVVIEPATVDLFSLRGVLKHDGPPVTVEAMDDAIAAAVSKSVLQS